jgi:hypothetical protein
MQEVREREVKMDIKFNLVPFGKRGKDRKGETFPNGWREYQNRYYDGEITEDDNVVLITGKLPGQDIQVVVLDFDGCFDLKSMGDILKGLNLIDRDLPSLVYQIIDTGNKGKHFIYLCDMEVEIRNTQKRKHKEKYFPIKIKGIDVRGNGGLVYYPPTHFIDSKQEYKRYITRPTPKIISSNVIQKFINRVYEKKKPKYKYKPDIKKDIQVIYNDRISSLRKPLRDLVSEGARDIEDIADETGVLEFLYWKALWLEAMHHDISVELMTRLLSRYQDSYDHAETMHQLNYLDGSMRPFTNAKLQEMFPWWESGTKRKFRGFVE